MALLACKRGASSFRSGPVARQWAINMMSSGRVWIVLSAREGTPAFSTAVTDLQSWSHFAPGDHDLIQDKLKFLSDAAERDKVSPACFL